MRLRIIYLTVFSLTIISCGQTEKSKEIMKEAMDFYFFSNESNDVKIERSLELTNEALELDNHNIAALTHKTTILFRKKDIEGLLQTVDVLIHLMPENPNYLVQKALYLELQGDNSNANKYYESAQSKYQRHLKKDSLNFNLLVEYVSFLQVTGDTTTANKTLKKIEIMNLEDAQKEMLSVYKSQVHSKQSSSKELLMKYWKGEIAYEEIEGNFEQK